MDVAEYEVKPTDNFLFKFCVGMLLDQACANIELDVEATRRMAEAAGITFPIPEELGQSCHNQMLKASASVAMMNDAGGEFPCVRVGDLFGSDPKSEWAALMKLVGAC